MIKKTVKIGEGTVVLPGSVIFDNINIGKNNWIGIATNDFIFKLLVCYIAFLPIYLIILNSLFSLIRRK